MEKEEKESKIIRRKKFTSEEDALIRELIPKLGDKNWMMMSKHLPGRTPRQVRDRWKNYLCPTITNDPWTAADDTLLYKYVMQYGPHWVTIAKLMPGRTDSNLKNRWSLMRRCWNKASPHQDTDPTNLRFQAPYAHTMQISMMQNNVMYQMISAPCSYNNDNNQQIQTNTTQQTNQCTIVTNIHENASMPTSETNFQPSFITATESIGYPSYQQISTAKQDDIELHMNINSSESESQTDDSLLHFDGEEPCYDEQRRNLAWPQLEN